MPARKTILAMLIGGPLMGTLMGIAADPQMLPPPEPSWRKARPDPIYTEQRQPQRTVEIGPLDLSPNWYMDRMPTWKRRAAEQEAAAYAALQYADYPEQPADPPAPPPAPEPAFAGKVVTWPAAAPLHDAAAGQAADRDAQAGAGTEARPALTDRQEPSETSPDPVAPAEAGA